MRAAQKSNFRYFAGLAPAGSQNIRTIEFYAFTGTSSVALNGLVEISVDGNPMESRPIAGVAPTVTRFVSKAVEIPPGAEISVKFHNYTITRFPSLCWDAERTFPGASVERYRKTDNSASYISFKLRTSEADISNAAVIPFHISTLHSLDLLDGVYDSLQGSFVQRHLANGPNYHTLRTQGYYPELGFTHFEHTWSGAWNRVIASLSINADRFYDKEVILSGDISDNTKRNTQETVHVTRIDYPAGLWLNPDENQYLETFNRAKDSPLSVTFAKLPERHISIDISSLFASSAAFSGGSGYNQLVIFIPNIPVAEQEMGYYGFDLNNVEIHVAGSKYVP